MTEGAPGQTVFDPCCGSGRMLLAAADVDRNREFVGQDVDLRCVKITALNLALRNLYGAVLWGDALRGACRAAYRTGFDGRGFVRALPPETAAHVVSPAAVMSPPPEGTGDRLTDVRQCSLFDE